MTYSLSYPDTMSRQIVKWLEICNIDWKLSDCWRVDVISSTGNQSDSGACHPNLKHILLDVYCIAHLMSNMVFKYIEFSKKKPLELKKLSFLYKICHVVHIYFSIAIMTFMYYLQCNSFHGHWHHKSFSCKNKTIYHILFIMYLPKCLRWSWDTVDEIGLTLNHQFLDLFQWMVSLSSGQVQGFAN